MDPDARILDLVRKLGEVRALNPKTFGSTKHGFTLSPPLVEPAVLAFESAHGVTLPADFRAFITRAGASGAGPYYGLLPLEDWDLHLSAEERIPDWLSRPCLFGPDTTPDDATYAAVTSDAVEPFQGSIAIVDQGCAYYAALVVTGPHRGRVMYVNADGAVPLFVENEDFLSWYERWLDELLWGHEHFWFGRGMPGSERTLAEAARGAASPRRLDAIHAMWRLPRLGDATAEIVLDRARDGDPAVRAAALALLAKLRVTGAATALREALGDPHALVRLAALLGLVTLCEAWHDDAKKLLGDPDPALAARAFDELTRARALTDAEIVARLHGAPDAIVALAIRALAATPAAIAVEPLLARARPGSPQDTLPALLQHVRAGLASRAQNEEVFDLALASFDADPCSRTMIAFEAFAAFPDLAARAVVKAGEATRSSDGFVRFDAARVLGVLGGEESIDLLRGLEADPTMPSDRNRGTGWSVGANATKAIEKIRGRARQV